MATIYKGSPVGGSGSASVNFNDAMNLTVERSRFVQPYLTNTTGDFGMMIPVLVTDTNPSDHFTLRIEALMRLAPMIKPTMHPIDLEAYAFNVPRRILWPDFTEFYRGGDSGDEVYAIPKVSDMIDIHRANNPGINIAEDETIFGEETLWDYMGLPIIGQDGITDIYEISKAIDAMPFMAYYRIWYEKFRDQDLQNQDHYNYKLPTNGVGEGYFDISQLFKIKPVAIDKDYLSTAREWQQKGIVPAIPLEGLINVGILDTQSQIWGQLDASADENYFTSDLINPPGSIATTPDQIDGKYILSGGTVLGEKIGLPTGEHRAMFPSNPNTGYGGFKVTPAIYGQTHDGAVIAKLDSSIGVGVTPIQQRNVLALQHQAERMARGGNRFVDILQINFGISIPDATAQIPEYIGGWQVPVIINEVLKTGSETPTEPIGSLAGHATASGVGVLGEYLAVEPGIAIVIIIAKPRTIMYQGIDRFWLKETKYDFIWPDFVSLSEQGIKRGEVFVDATSTVDEINEIWGYQEQYGHYKRGRNKLTGKMRTTLKNWQIPLEIVRGTNDNLSEAHIVWDGRDPLKKLIFAVPSEPSFQISVGIEMDLFRPLPFITIPGLETV